MGQNSVKTWWTRVLPGKAYTTPFGAGMYMTIPSPAPSGMVTSMVANCAFSSGCGVPRGGGRSPRRAGGRDRVVAESRPSWPFPPPGAASSSVGGSYHTCGGQTRRPDQRPRGGGEGGE